MTFGIILCLCTLLSYHATSQEMYTIDVSKGIKSAGNHYLSSIAASVEYVPLEAKAGTFIKSTRKWAFGENMLVKPYVILKKDKRAVEINRLKYDDRLNIDVQNSQYYPRSVYENKDYIFVNVTGPKYSNRLVFSKSTGDMFNLNLKDNIIDNGYTNDIDRGPAYPPGRYIGDSLGIVLYNPRNITANATYYDRKPQKYDPELVDLDLWAKLVEFGNPVLMKVKLK